MNTRWTEEQIFEDDNENKVFGVGYSFKKSKIRIKGRKSKFFAFTFTIFLVALILLIGNLTNNIILANANNSSNMLINETKFYAISVSAFVSKELAMQTSQEIKKVGGGGYVLLKNNKYYVLTSIYNKESSALSVCNKLINMNYSPEVVELSSKKINYDSHFASLSKEQKNNIANLLTIFDEAFEKINYLSLQYDQNQLTVVECKKEVLDFSNQYLPRYKEYLTCVENLSGKEISSLTQSLHTMFEKLEELCKVASNYSNYTSLLKNALTAIAISKCELT